MPQAYRLKTNRMEYPAGTVVYGQTMPDYGLASDDSAVTGVRHISVTLNRGGGYPGFTIAATDLDPCEAPALPTLTQEHIQTVCRPGAGAATCRYLTVGADGFECAKITALQFELDGRVERGSMVARGDNCEGREGNA